jgi:hypothetical protein
MNTRTVVAIVCVAAVLVVIAIRTSVTVSVAVGGVGGDWKRRVKCRPGGRSALAARGIWPIRVPQGSL